MTDSNDTRSRPAGLAAPVPDPAVSRWLAVTMLAEAVTFGFASYLHLGGRIPLGFTTIAGEHFPAAAVPEAIIGCVLAVGGVWALALARGARAAARGAVGFAILGVALGLTALLRGSRPDITADLAYHGVIMAALLSTFILLRRQGRAS